MSNSSVIDIDGLKVIFPYPVPYPEQIKYMTQLKLSLDAGANVFQRCHQAQERLFAFFPELDQGIAELCNVSRTLVSATGSDYGKNFLEISLTSRVNSCVNPSVSRLANRSECWNRTFPCPPIAATLRSHLHAAAPGVYGTSATKEFSIANGVCPFFLMRRLTVEAQVIMSSYARILKSLFRTSQRTQLSCSTRHTTDVCCELRSSFVGKKMLDKSVVALNSGQEMFDE